MKIGRETGIPNSVNHTAGGAYNAVRLLSVAASERTVFNGRTTVPQPLTDASPSNRSAHESHTY
jgi:hypothetical protein